MAVPDDSSVFKESALSEEDLTNLVRREAYPILFRADGSMYPLEGHSDLLGFDLQDNDLIVVGPHGEIVPFAALAFRQRLFETLGAVFFQIDAHYDSYKSKNLNLPATILFEILLRRRINFSSHLARQDIEKFLADLPESEACSVFMDLCETMERDVETFIASVRELFENVVAFIRPEGRPDIVGRRAVSTDEYLADDFETDRSSIDTRSLSELVSTFRSRFNFYSVDGDFTGVKREKRPDDLFERAMAELIEAMVASAQNGDGQKSLYGVSLDKRYVADPVRFILQFLRKFYFPEIVEKRA